VIKKTHLAREMAVSVAGRALARKLGFKLEQIEDWLRVLYQLSSATTAEALKISLEVAESTEFGLALIGIVEERARKIREDSNAVRSLDMLDRSKIVRNIKVTSFFFENVTSFKAQITKDINHKLQTAHALIATRTELQV